MLRITSLLLFLCFFANAQNIKSPETYFGFGYGKRFYFHHQMVEYAKYITNTNTKQTKLLPYGKTTEGRELFVVAFGSEENIKNLEEIRKSNLSNIGLIQGNKKQNIPAITMLSYNIHGNEAVNTSVAFSMLYELGKGNSPLAEKIFKNSIVIIDPCANPDGYDRYTQWYNRHIGMNANPNPDAIEHKEPWPGGRYNHYHMDMNRDLAWQTQHETQQRVQFYNSWMPHFHGDFHEMGPDSPYFFAPSAKPFHEDLTNFQKDFQHLIGNYHKRDFDKNGWLYYTKERFDLLYPSYGDTYPSYNGALAMTYEQGGSGVAGLSYVRSEGDTLTLEDRMKHTYSTSLAALEAVSDNADKIKEAFNAYFNEPFKNGYGKYKSYIMKGSSANIEALTKLLNKLQIEYSFATAKTSTKGFNYQTQKEETFNLEKEDLIVNTYQPKGILTKIMFEPHTMLEDSNTYDITAWALPYVYGLEAYATTAKIEGSKAIAKPLPVLNADKVYAYALPLQSFEDYQFLGTALQKGFKARLQPTTFTVNQKDFPAGTVIFTKLNDQNFETKMAQLLQSYSAKLEPIYSGMVEKGMDLGLDDVVSISAPRVGILMGQGISATGFGEIWHYFDQQLQYPTTLLDKSTFGKFDFNNYDVLIFPSGRYEKSIVESNELKSWINKGGRLILVESANDSFANVDGYELKRRAKTESKPNISKKYGEASRASISNSIPGAIYEIKLDNSHPLAYGYTETMHMLVKSPKNFEAFKEGWNVGLIGKHKSGFVGYNVKNDIENAPIFAVQDKGRGKVIYLTESPIFRGFWHSGKALFANAVFFVK